MLLISLVVNLSVVLRCMGFGAMVNVNGKGSNEMKCIQGERMVN